MPDSLTVLDAQRTKLLQQFLSFGDLRSGSITAQSASLRKADLPLRGCA